MSSRLAGSLHASSGHWLFAHDTRFANRAGEVYTEDAFPAQLWARYLAYASRLTILARKFENASKAAEAKLQSSAAHVDFCLCPNISSPYKRVVRSKLARSLVRMAVAQVDGVIARLPSEYGLLAITEARLAGKPWLVEMAGCPWDGLWNYGNWQGKAYAPVMAARTRHAVARAPYVVYVTKEFLQRRYPSRSQQQIACSDVVIETPSVAVLEQRKERILARSEPIVLGLIGTLKTRYKGIQTVFAALARCRNALPPVEFRVLGQGDAMSWMAEAQSHGVADIVRFDGVRSPEADVMNWLDDVDVYLQPSFKEGLPRATVEAMSRGCPVIGSTCGGIPELLERDWCIRPGDDQHLAELIIQMIRDQGLQLRVAERNWRKAHEYSPAILDERRNRLLTAFAQDAAETAKRGVA